MTAPQLVDLCPFQNSSAHDSGIPVLTIFETI